MIKFTDVAHYYLNCEILRQDGEIVRLVVAGLLGSMEQRYRTLQGGMSFTGPLGEFDKPLLRDIKCITDDEINLLHDTVLTDKNELEKFAHHTTSYKRTFVWIHIAGRKYDPKVFRFLLEHGFDLFELIKAGEAVDKNEYLKSLPNE